MYRLGWAGLGMLVGVILAGGFAIVIVQILIPWEAICATVAPSQEVVRLGSLLIAELQAWLLKAEEFIGSGGSPAQGTEVREGLGGLLDRAKGEVQAATNVIVDVVTAPLRLLIDAAQVILDAVQGVVDAARESLDSIDQSRCS